MEYEKAHKIIETLIKEKIEKIKADAEMCGIDEETTKLFIYDITEAFNALTDIGDIKDLKENTSAKYKHLMDLAFEVYSDDLYRPKVDEVLASLWKKLSHFFQKENHIELQETVSLYDVIQNIKKDERGK
jgi:hypothetical protein